MRKRTPQEIADFFGCYVAQDENGAWYGYDDKPELAENTWRVNNKGFTFIPETMIDFPFNHDWKQLYEPRKSDVINEESGKNCQKSDLCPQHSEVYIHKEYLVEGFDTMKKLNTRITELINQGWKPCGGVSVTRDTRSIYGAVYYQAMVRGV